MSRLINSRFAKYWRRKKHWMWNRDGICLNNGGRLSFSVLKYHKGRKAYWHVCLRIGGVVWSRNYFNEILMKKKQRRGVM